MQKKRSEVLHLAALVELRCPRNRADGVGRDLRIILRPLKRGPEREMRADFQRIAFVDDVGDTPLSG